MKNCSRLLVIAMLIAIVHCAAIEESDLPDAPLTEAQVFFNQVPEDQREKFIIYYLARGLREKRRSPRTPKMIDEEADFGTPPVGFAVDLLDWAKDHFEMTDENVQKLVEQEYVCMPSKGCYDPNDIGGHCCPFESKKAK